MTKIQLSFPLSAALDDAQLARMADLHGTYGIIRVHSELDSLRVEYDATRFGAKDVEAALARAGLPLSQRGV